MKWAAVLVTACLGLALAGLLAAAKPLEEPAPAPLLFGDIPVPRTVRQCEAYLLIHPGDSWGKVVDILGDTSVGCYGKTMGFVYEGVCIYVDMSDDTVNEVVLNLWPWEDTPDAWLSNADRHNKVPMDYGQLRLLRMLGIYR